MSFTIAWKYRADDTPSNIRNIFNSISWLEKAANCENANAMEDLGQIYLFASSYGLGEDDFMKALPWFKKASELGSAEAMKMIGDCYCCQYGGAPRDYDKALDWYLKASEAGNKEVYASIGLIYDEKSNLLEAHKWLQKAIQYDEEEGIDVSMDKAWLHKIEKKMKI